MFNVHNFDKKLKMCALKLAGRLEQRRTEAETEPGLRWKGAVVFCYTVAYGTADTVLISDYFGVETGRKVNKIEKAGCHVRRSQHVNAPIIEEYPLTLECRVKSWDPDTGYLIGEVVAWQADESILTDGKVDLGKLRPIIFDPAFNAYRVVGEVVGHAFSDGLKLK